MCAWVAVHWPGETLRGEGSYYETVVYRVGKVCDMADCMCGLPALEGEALYEAVYKTAGEATLGHNKQCLEWAEKQ